MNARTLSIVAIGAAGSLAQASTVYYSQDFEADGVGYSMSAPYTVSNQSHFLYGTTSTAPLSTYSGTSGNFVSGFNTNYFGTSRNVTTDSFNIAGVSELDFAVDLATHTIVPSWEDTSHVEFEYRVDGGSWESIFTADSDGADPGAPFVNGVAITNTFSTFSSTISGLSGSIMEIRVVWMDMNPGDSLAIDNIFVSSLAAVPLPSAALAGMGMLAGLGAYRRVRR